MGKTRRRRNVWLYLVNGKEPRDLELLDSRGFDTWRANPKTRAGDLIVMYRTAPFKDIAYVFVAISNPRERKNWYGSHSIEIGDGYRLPRTIKLDELRKVPALKKWAFLSAYQGMMMRVQDLQEEGVWPSLSQVIEERAPAIADHFGKIWSGAGRRRHVFISYASQNEHQARKLYHALAKQGIDAWLDRLELRPADDWAETIGHAIKTSRAFLVCLSKTWIRRKGYVKRELDAALEIAKTRKRFVFNVKVEKCHLPQRLAAFQAHQIYGRQREANLEALVRAVRIRVGLKVRKRSVLRQSKSRST